MSKNGDEEVVEIPAKIGKASVTSIGVRAFSVRKQSIKNVESRKKIKKVVIPKGVIEIESYAFNGCESLETINIPYTLKKIGAFVFFGCPKLKRMDLPLRVKVDRTAFGR